MTNPTAVIEMPSETKSARFSLPSVLAPLASLRLTVVLFVLSMILVFTGTLAQMDAGIWTVVKQYFRSFYVWVPLQTYMGLLRVFLGITTAEPLPSWLGFPFPGGWTIGAALLINLLAAHAIRFRFTWNRAGILLTHAGIVLLLLGELVTGLFQVEAKVPIANGETVTFADVSQNAELAFVSVADGNQRDEVTIPQSKLSSGAWIKSPELPVDVEVVQFAKNSNLREAKPGEAAALLGADGQAYGIDLQHQEAAGVDAQATEDIPAAIIRFCKRGTHEEIASGVFSLWHNRNVSRLTSFPPRSLTVDGKTWFVELRPKREYKPFSLQLLEFRHDVYLGTDTPKNFSSLIRLRDSERNEDRNVLISMNSPLYYRGETFYQAGYLPGDTGTILQVVRNPGWILPYLSCTIVALGMLMHFVPRLSAFLHRARNRGSATPVSHAAAWATAMLALGYVAFTGWPLREPASAMRLSEFGRLPVVDGGRTKPLDSFARTTLQSISSRQEVRVESGKSTTTLTPVQWLLDVWSSSDMFDGPASKYRVFRIENDGVLNALHLEQRPGSFRYSLVELAPHYGELMRQYRKIRQMDSKKRDLFQSKLFELGQHLAAYEDVIRMRAPRVIPPQDNSDQAWPIAALIESDRRQLFEVVSAEMQKDPEKMQRITALQLAALEAKIDEMAIQRLPQTSPAGAAFMKIIRSYRDSNGKAAGFNESLAQFQNTYLNQVSETDRQKSNLEYAFNRVAPFYQCSILYVLLFVVTCVSWLTVNSTLYRAAWGLALITFALHSVAILTRMYIQSRPPVTNLYSSAIYIGCFSAGALIVCERLYRNGIPLMLAGVLGATSLFVAHFLGLGGDTLEMMQAVLDTNFWLATHVVAVTTGYAAAFVAGFIAVGFVLGSVFTSWLDRDARKSLIDMIYGIVCFATLMSFVGTVLGGIWADQSWGRFWGWDPKENGALLIVIWNALILHARWAGLAKARGVAVLAVLGNIVTAWSWFGTNQLGVGLHSYGFTSGISTALVVFNLIMLAVAGLGMMPERLWASSRTSTAVS